jgi:hypothetical protein
MRVFQAQTKIGAFSAENPTIVQAPADGEEFAVMPPGSLVAYDDTEGTCLITIEDDLVAVPASWVLVQ